MQVDESGNLIIARILGGSTAADQGLLRVGEVILEVNGKEVHTPDELQQSIVEANENLTLKLAPGIATDGKKPIKSMVSDQGVEILFPTWNTFKMQIEQYHSKVASLLPRFLNSNLLNLLQVWV